MMGVLYIDRILYPVTALGPGKRIALWTAGCSRHCDGCANPELWERNGSQRMDVDVAWNLVRTVLETYEVGGITLTGGEPFEQTEGLAELLSKIRQKYDVNVLSFSGYLYEELMRDQEKAVLLSYLDVLIDGAYVKEKNDGKTALRGSSNQRILFLNKSCDKEYREYLQKGRQIQNFIYDREILSVGIHKEDRADKQ